MNKNSSKIKLQQSDSGDDMNYERDINKLKTIWKEVKKDKERQQQNAETVKEIPDIRDSFHDNNQIIINQSLQEKLKSLEFHLEKAHDNNELLSKKLYQTERELADSKSLIQKLQNEKSWKNQQMDQLNYRFGSIEHSQEEILSNARFNVQTLQLELEHKDKEIKNLQDIIQERNDKLKVVSVTQESNLDKCLELDKKLRAFDQENQMLKQQLHDKDMENDSLKFQQKSEGTFMVEVEHLRSDVRRLMRMLKNTSEFKDFAEIADDEGFNIRFLKDVKAKSYVDIGCGCKCRSIRPWCPACVQDEILDEKMLWCPEEAWKFAQEFRLRYQGEMTDILIERLLFELNKIWSRREKKLIQQVKSNCTHEISALRRQLAFNPKYDEHQAKATINRLQNQLKQAYKENRETYASRENRNPPGVKFLSEALKMTRTVSKAKKDAEEKNKILKQKLSDIQNNNSDESQQKTLFMEGASWMCKQIQEESKMLKDQFLNFIKLYQEKENQMIESNEFDHNSLQRKSDWLIENIETLINQYAKQIKDYKNNSEQQMSKAWQQSKKISQSFNGYINTH